MNKITKWKRFATKSKPAVIVIARNVKTGKLVKLPMSSQDEYKRFRWYPQTDYVPLKTKK